MNNSMNLLTHLRPCLILVAAFLAMAAEIPAQYLAEAFRIPNSMPSMVTGLNYSVIAADLNQNGAADLVYLDDHGLLAAAFYQVDLDPAVGGVGPYAQQAYGVGWTGIGGAREGLAGDVNGDGLVDLVFNRLCSVTVSLGNGNGTFVPPTAYVVVNNLSQANLYRMVTLDANNDGAPDLLFVQVPNNNTADMVLCLNQYPGWSSVVVAPVSVAFYYNNSSGPFVGDFDGDGNADIVFQNSLTYAGPLYTMVYWGNGAGQFALSSTNVPGFPAAGMTAGPPKIRGIADMDGDGCSDMVCTSAANTGGVSTGQLQVFRGSSSRAVIPAGIHVVPSTVDITQARIHAGDFNADGSGDALYISTSMSASALCDFEVTMAIGLPGGQFHQIGMNTMHSPNNAASCPMSTVADFDGDTDLDLAGTPRGSPFYYFNNRTLSGSGCAGSTTSAPGIWPSAAQLGNPGFGVTLYGAPIYSASLLAIATGPSAGPFNTCGVYVDLLGVVVLLPGVTNSNGNSVWPLPVPNNPTLHGATFHAQAAVFDPLGPSLGGLNLALTAARTVIVW